MHLLGVLYRLEEDLVIVLCVRVLWFVCWLL